MYVLFSILFIIFIIIFVVGFITIYVLFNILHYTNANKKSKDIDKRWRKFMDED